MTEVTIYTTTTCPYCHLEKEYLKQKGIKFKEISVDQEPDQIKAMLDTCGSMGVPCTHIVKADGTELKILGFNKPKLDKALGIS